MGIQMAWSCTSAREMCIKKKVVHDRLAHSNDHHIAALSGSECSFTHATASALQYCLQCHVLGISKQCMNGLGIVLRILVPAHLVGCRTEQNP